MKKIIVCLLLISPCMLFAQFGVKAGLNFANVTNASSINSSSSTGFHAGIFLAGPSKGVLSSLTELQYSRQGYKYSTNTNTGTVNLNYLILPQFMAINITKFVQIQVGAQIAYLLNASIDSTSATGNASEDDIIELYNRFDFGFGGGVEVHPFHFLVVGARINLFYGQLYKEPDPEDPIPPFVPDIDATNNLFQLYAGYKFGKKEVE